MNTNQLKPFAQKARNIIRDGVARQLIYWGFDEKGNMECQPEKVEGGVVHRGLAIDDPQILKQWAALRGAVKRHGFDQVVEEAAYTWFNRLMAIRILAKNGYDLAQLEYSTDGAQVPLILQRARRGQYAFLNQEEQNRLNLILTDYSKEAKAFAILITGYCHSHTLLNNVFGRMDDYTEMLLPGDILNESGFIHFLNTSTAISDDDYRKVELIGWLYQFYISEKKDEVFKQFKKNQKAEAKDIPAATQIFTPNWIVKYMVENTLGKTWLDLHPQSPLREKMKYLVADQNNTDNASETKQALVSEVSQLKLLDPASGSGHILVEGFDLLYQMYLEEYYMPDEAVESIFANNLFGLDIDLRAAQLARFALLMKAATKHPEILKRNILPKVFAMPAPNEFSRQEILDFLGDEGRQYEEKFSAALDLMQQAQNLGSVMRFGWTIEERAFLVSRLETLKNKAYRDALEEASLHKIAPFMEVLAILTDQYEAIAANPPYMGQGNMNGELKNYVNTRYPASKSDLMTVFMEVIPNLTKENFRFSLINMPSWLFLSSFEKLRGSYVSNFEYESLLHMGRGIFGIDFGSVAFSVKKQKNPNARGNYFRLHERNFQHIHYEDIEKLFLYSNGNIDYKYDFSLYRDDVGKTKIPETGTKVGLKLYFPNIPQSNFSKIPGSPIAYWVSERTSILFLREKIGRYGISDGQNITGDNGKYLKNIWEISKEKLGKGYKWVPVAKGGAFKKWFGNIADVIDWSIEAREFYRKDKIARIQDKDLWFRYGITWNLVSSGGTGFRLLENTVLFNKAAPTILLDENNLSKLNYLLGFLNTKIVKEFLKLLNPTFNTNIAEVLSLPLIEENKKEPSENVKLCIEISKKDWDSRETSWDFQQTPLLNPSDLLDQAYANWAQKASADFFQLHANEEELNRLFIDIYDLNEELDPLVPLKDITILQDELDTKTLEKTEQALRQRRQWKLTDGKWVLHEDESVPLPALPIKRDVVMKQFISYAIGCMMGRYRLDQPGLHIAHPNPSSEEVCTYMFNSQTIEIDDDAIIPLMGSNCTFADDAVNRFNHFLEVIWGAEPLTQNKNFLQECLDQEIEKYLVNSFWKDHCRTYKKKPIYWLFSSEKGAFQVLVYMHRMNRFTAEKIRSKYLLKHLQFLQQEIDRLDVNTGKSREEQKRLDRLRNQYGECQRYEMLLKDCADRQIEFDLDDGVTANYELFKGVVAPIK